jgi:metal-responsive CopG/Arc/MetJ family transcriptional regulator
MTKRKLSVTLAEDVVRLADRAAERAGTSRSSVIDAWLRRAAVGEVENELRLATIAYYESLSRAERAEERAVALASSRAARRLSIERPPRRGGR